MNSNDLYYYEKFVKRQHTDPTLDRVKAWSHAIKEMLPKNVDLTPESDEIKAICQQYGFYSYHLLQHLKELNLVRQINTNLYRKV